MDFIGTLKKYTGYYEAHIPVEHGIQVHACSRARDTRMAMNIGCIQKDNLCIVPFPDSIRPGDQITIDVVAYGERLAYAGIYRDWQGIQTHGSLVFQIEEE